MKKTIIALTLGIVFVIAIIALQPSIENPSAPVAATTFPIYDITRNIADGEVNVELIVPPGVSPHTFETTPSTLNRLQDTKIVYATGYGIDDWTDQIVQSINAETVVVDAGVEIRSNEEEHQEHKNERDEDHGHEHSGEDPHYWLTIENAKNIAETIAVDLSARYPEHADGFETNLNRYLIELEQAEDEIFEIFEGVENKNIITLHDAWYYFAEEYGLNIVGTFEPSAGREPTPQYLAALSDAVKQSDARTLYSEPQLSISSLQSFLEDNDLVIAELDPIGGVAGRESYIQMMKYNANTIAQNQ